MKIGKTKINMTIQRGTKGDKVKAIQQVLGIEADGIFGIQTENAVKEFQRANGLVADGIVGDKTWAKMFYDDGVGTVDITNAFIYTHITYSPNRQIKYIAIHYTAGSTSRKGSALNTRNVFLSRQASADFVVDDDTIVQINPSLKNYYCWSVGDRKNNSTGGGQLNGKATNKNTISIEICSNLKQGWSAAYANHDGWYFTEESLALARLLVRHLMMMYGIPKENVVRHYDITGKMCPGIVGWNNATIYNNSGKATTRKNDSSLWKKFWESI